VIYHSRVGGNPGISMASGSPLSRGWPVRLILKESLFMTSAHTIDEIRQALSGWEDGAVVFVDVDDTLITPQSKLFRWTSPYRFLIDDLKKDRQRYQNFEEIISHWRLTRKTMLISEDWPALIQDLKKRSKVYALTKMESGALGKIPSMEKWRHEELKRKGITFTPSFQNLNEALLSDEKSEGNPSSFYGGIFITGSFPKSAVIRSYLKSNKPSQIIFIDDRIEYLQDVQQECQRQNIPFLGIHFKGMERIDGSPDPKVAEFQKASLLEKCQWWEDEEAEKLLK
jgi:hypothetical protein